MLAVTRKLKDRIHIDDDIVIHILEVKAKSVKIGIEAPPNHLIYRGEIYDKIVEANKEMASPTFDAEDVKAFVNKTGNAK